MDLRCDGTLHGKLENNLLEVKCRRRKCGYKNGVVVLHKFNVHTGELVDTKRFADPAQEIHHGIDDPPAAVRSAVRAAVPSGQRRGPDRGRIGAAARG